MSRIGARVRLPLAELDLIPQAGLPEISASVGKTLGDIVVADLNHSELGTLVRRSLRVVRLARPPEHPTVVDIGCMLRVPLTDEEVGALGLSLPEQHLPHGVYSAHEAFAKLKRKRKPTEGEDEPQAQAFLSAQADCAGPPVRATDAAWTERGVLLRFDPRASAALNMGSRDAGQLFQRFVHEYGAEVGLLLVRNHQPLWSGTVKLRAVEIDPLRDDIFLEFEAARPMAEQGVDVSA